jgi:hypothetical protein
MVGAGGQARDRLWGAAFRDRLAHALDLVSGQVVHDDQVARTQRRRHGLLDLSQEARSVDRAIERPGRGQAVVAQRGDEGRAARRRPRAGVLEGMTAPFIRWTAVG